ncbi:MAG: DUF3109 family protein [Prolixibacteraceae bacterium]|jgi:hypothetical protein|nr:DUF3109 family protein [Prolixibacteraceae bacterium]MBT6007585.1 DUF3109 family protein [Prolixibacteraceae bacterium]MBT6764102.1 DUF3109 family protein [Prolixibacteraceae bacterium]MBT7000284.1 DUF3109 family protein [Prolixibacteraceae bacterium]MBT7394023.1 DUF3109 family protein [Prolixibacteraceae bacterium]
MVEIGRTIISRDIFEKHFLCDLSKCKGACCVEGDSGAPLTEEEAKIIARDYPHFQNYISGKHRREIEKHGFSIIDSDGDLVTPLVNNKQCVYSFYDKKKILKCSIEKAFFEGKIKFKKPVSCHLFPIRVTEYKRFDAINYEELDICKPGRACGQSEQLPMYKFLKEPLIKKYGEEWYKEVEIAAGYLIK